MIKIMAEHSQQKNHVTRNLVIYIDRWEQLEEPNPSILWCNRPNENQIKEYTGYCRQGLAKSYMWKTQQHYQRNQYQAIQELLDNIEDWTDMAVPWPPHGDMAHSVKGLMLMMIVMMIN